VEKGEMDAVSKTKLGDLALESKDVVSELQIPSERQEIDPHIDQEE
jgi:hypothetical protein